MKDLRLITLTLTMAVLLGGFTLPAGALAAEEGNVLQDHDDPEQGSETDNDAAGDSGTQITAENGIPVLIIRVDESDGNGTIEEMNESIDHAAECTGTLQIIVPDGFTYCDLDTVPQSIGPVRLDYIRGRGNSTWDQAKKPYKIKLDKKADLLGLGGNKHWVLIANALDGTAVKDRFTGWLGDQLGFEGTPNGVPVDVVMVAERDGEEVSRQDLGSYLLSEQVRIGKERLNIRELKAEDTAPEDITGGYLMQFGQQTGEDDPDHFFTERGLDLANDSPTFDLSDSGYTNELQKEYIRDYIRNTENALFGEGADDDSDPYTDIDGVRYSEYMDVDSAAKYWLVQEASRNEDAYRTGSSYLYKSEDRLDEAGNVTGKGKIFWGPLWDFDKAWGYPDMETEGFLSADDTWISAMLYDSDDSGLRRTAQREWPQVRDTILSALEEGGLIDRYYAETKQSYDADYEIWKDVMPDEYAGRDDYRRNIDDFKQWVRDRLSWMDAHMSGTAQDGEPTLDDTVCKVTYVVDGRTVRREYYKKGLICQLNIPGESEDGFRPEKEGAEFTGWIDEDGNRPDSGVIVEKDRVFTAQFDGEEEGSGETDPAQETSEEPENAPGGSTEPADPGAAPHVHDLVRRAPYSPTCTEDGSIEYWACKDCGKLFADAEGKEEITKRSTVKNALGHDWGHWEGTRKATVDEEGLEVRYCLRCGETEERAIPKLDPEDEQYDAAPGKKSDAAPGAAPGGSSETEQGNNGKHDQHDRDEKDSGNEKQERPRDTTNTGDDSNMLLWILLILASLGGIGGLIWYRRRR